MITEPQVSCASHRYLSFRGQRHVSQPPPLSPPYPRQTSAATNPHSAPPGPPRTGPGRRPPRRRAAGHCQYAAPARPRARGGPRWRVSPSWRRRWRTRGVVAGSARSSNTTTSKEGYIRKRIKRKSAKNAGRPLIRKADFFDLRVKPTGTCGLNLPPYPHLRVKPTTLPPPAG